MERVVLFLLIAAICIVSENEADQDETYHFKQLVTFCGDAINPLWKKSGAIVGGTEAHPNAWPWMAAIGNSQYGSSFFWVCGGSLIHKRYVLTAAHCCPEFSRWKEVHVLLGQHNMIKNTDGAVVTVVDKRFCHEKYNLRGNSENDVALLRLREDVYFSDTIRPICLPPPEKDCPDAGQYFDGKTLTVIGWGQTSEGGYESDVLREVDLYGINIEECRRAHPYMIRDNRLCAGVRGGGKDACQGDSGGPLMFKFTRPSGPIYVVVGIVSGGEGCARPDKYGIFTRVSDYMPWILEKIEE